LLTEEAEQAYRSLTIHRLACSIGFPPDVPTCSTVVEGGPLALSEVETLLLQDRAVSAKLLREYNEVKGYADAARWVYGQAHEPGGWRGGRLLAMSEVHHVHHLAMTPIWEVARPPGASDRERPGNFRRHHIHTFAGGMTPPAWPLVPDRMRQWLEDICATLARTRPGAATRLPEALARCHNEFERVHPFVDGNGRTGRLVMNLGLVRLGHPRVIFFKRQRAAYLAAMRRADRGNYGALAELIAQAMHASQTRAVAPGVVGSDRMVPLATRADEELTHQRWPENSACHE
jgi:Fic family protein